MVKVDGTKLQEIKDRFKELAKREIAQAINDPETDELKDDDIEAIHQKWKFVSNKEVEKVINMSPEKLFKSGFALASDGWREGYTKPLIKDRKAKRRVKNKLARKARKQSKK